MIGFARRIARNAVGIGMAIGILMAPQVTNAARTHLEFATSAAATHGTAARATPALPDYVTIQKTIREAIFAGAPDASAYYFLDSLPVDDANWTIGGSAYGGVRFQLDVLSAQELSNVSNNPA